MSNLSSQFSIEDLKRLQVLKRAMRETEKTITALFNSQTRLANQIEAEKAFFFLYRTEARQILGDEYAQWEQAMRAGKSATVNQLYDERQQPETQCS